MNESVPHKKALDRTKLELSMELAESSFGKLLSIAASDVTIGDSDEPEAATLTEHDWTPVPVMSLRLVIDESGYAEPEGMILVARGEAYIENEKKKVSLFRQE